MCNLEAALRYALASSRPRLAVAPCLQQHISGPDAANRIFIGGLPYYLNEEQVRFVQCMIALSCLVTVLAGQTHGPPPGLLGSLSSAVPQP